MKNRYKIFILAAAVMCLGGCQQENSEKDVSITLADGASYSDGNGVVINDDSVSITQPGRYILKGKLTDGQITVNSPGNIELVLDGVNVSNSTGPAIYALSGSIDMYLNKDTENTFSDGAEYALLDSEGEPDAAFFCSDGLTIDGEGNIKVVGNHADAIAGKDDIVIDGGNFTLEAKGYGIKGKDSLTINGGSFELDTDGNGLGSSKGKVVINDGKTHINTGGKAVKGETDLEINGGSFDITASDDALHSNGTALINGGTFAINTEDDGVHAEEELVINDCDLKISNSNEGIEGHTITINGGSLDILSADDGLNAAAPDSGSQEDMPSPPDRGNWSEDMPRNAVPPDNNGERGGMPENMPTDFPRNDMPARQGHQRENTEGVPDFHGGMGGKMDSDESCEITINGGSIKVSSGGDGIDSNGDILINGGSVTVFGPENSGNAALDFGGKLDYNGGELLALGMSGMAQSPSEDSSQAYSIMYNSDIYAKDTPIEIRNNTTGETLTSITSPKSFSSVVYGSEKISENDVVEIRINGETAVSLQMNAKNVTSGTPSREGGMRMGGRHREDFTAAAEQTAQQNR